MVKVMKFKLESIVRSKERIAYACQKFSKGNPKKYVWQMVIEHAISLEREVSVRELANQFSLDERVIYRIFKRATENGYKVERRLTGHRSSMYMVQVNTEQ